MPINNAFFSMKTFMDHVNSANWTFTLAESSLAPLVQQLGGAYVKANGQDMRNLNRATLENVQGIIWPMGDGIATSPWGRKKKKYRLALGYLASTLYGVNNADALLVGTYKTGWVRRQLAANKKFVSASTAKEAELAASGGLSNRFSSEMCIPTGGMIGDWPDGHKYIFAAPMRLTDDGRLASAGAIKGQGFGNNTYCFERDALTRYMCMSDVENTPTYTGEVAFCDDVTRDYIKIYENRRPKVNPLWNATNWT